MKFGSQKNPSSLIAFAVLSITGAVIAEQCSSTNLCPMKEFPCCSQFGWCGNTADYCAPSKNCLSGCWPEDTLPPAPQTTTETTATAKPVKTRTAIKTLNPPTSTATTTYTIVATKKPKFIIPDYMNEAENPWYDERGVFSSCPIKHTISLTFDDGPSAYTPLLLSILREYGIKATFFVIGENLAKPGYADSIRLAHEEGHIIASHTWSHENIKTLSSTHFIKEIEKTADEIEKVIGLRPKYFRPPYGEYSEETLKYLFSKGYKVIMWNIDTNDWQYQSSHPEYIKQAFIDAFDATTNHLAKSWVPLMHDTYLPTVNSVKDIIKLGLKYKYRFLTINECFEDPNPYM